MAWLYKQPGSDYWWIGWRVNGKQFRKSTGEVDKKKAEAKRTEQEYLAKAAGEGRLTEAFIESLTGRPLSNLTFSSAKDGWLKECEGATKSGTVEKYRQTAKELATYLNATAEKPLLRDVSTDEIRAFLTAKRAKASVSTANLYRKILNVFFLRAIRNSQLKNNPMLPVRMFKESKEEKAGRRALTLEEIKLLYSKAPNDFWRFMVMAGYTTGLRMGDLVTLRWGAVDIPTNTIHLTTRKTGAVMHIPMAPPLSKFLEQQRTQAKSAKPEAYVWTEKAELYLRHRARVLSNEFYCQVLVPAGLAAPRTHQKAKAGRSVARDLGGVSFHSLRHSFVSMLKFTGASQSVAKELAGHSSDQISQLYTHTAPEALSQAINNLPWDK